MDFSDYCMSKADECELRSIEQDGARRAEWLLMAVEWRIAATLPHDLETPPLSL